MKKVRFDELKNTVKEIDFDEFLPQQIDFEQVVSNIGENQFVPRQRNEYLTQSLDLIPRELYDGTQHAWQWENVDETKVKDALMKGLTGNGVHHDSPVVARAVFESLKGHQEVLQTYLRGFVR